MCADRAVFYDVWLVRTGESLVHAFLPPSQEPDTIEYEYLFLTALTPAEEVYVRWRMNPSPRRQYISRKIKSHDFEATENDDDNKDSSSINNCSTTTVTARGMEEAASTNSARAAAATRVHQSARLLLCYVLLMCYRATVELQRIYSYTAMATVVTLSYMGFLSTVVVYLLFVVL